MTWLDDYTQWAMKRSPLTPKHFHDNIGLSLVAGAVAGRVYIQLPHERLNSNIWTLIVAKTSVFAKSTAFKVARELAQRSMSEKLLNSVSTPEALMSEFSGAKPSNLSQVSDEKRKAWEESAKWGARRLLMMDEAGRFFNALQRDYNATLDTLLMEAYDATGEPITRQTMKSGLIIVERPCLSCLFATTPANIRALLINQDQWTNGWWARWNFVTQEEGTNWITSEHIVPPNELATPLRNISHVLYEKYNAKEYNASIDSIVVTAHSEMTRELRTIILSTEDDKLHGVLGRLPTKRLKAALLFAIMESANGKVRVRESHWDRAAELSTAWDKDAQTAVKLSAKTERRDTEEKIFGIIRANHNAGGCTARYIQQYANKTARDVEQVLQTYIRNGTIAEQVRGRTKVFLLAVEEKVRVI